MFFSRLAIFSCIFLSLSVNAADKQLVYVVSDLRIPFWQILQRGIEKKAIDLGYQLQVYSAENSAKRELEFMVKAIEKKVDGIIVSPTNSSAAVTLLKLANSAGIPVVIADIGADRGQYVSYIASDNHAGSYHIGQVLTERMHSLAWDKGSVGIIAIPQKRANGQARTQGFMQALSEAGISGADIRQQVTFSYQETYDFAQELIQIHSNLRALWLQGSDRYQAALDAIADNGKQGEILLLCFDAEPEFLQMIPAGTLVGAAMQQPFLMGEEAVTVMDAHLQGKTVKQQLLLPVLAISKKNIQQQLDIIKRNVLGLIGE